MRTISQVEAALAAVDRRLAGVEADSRRAFAGADADNPGPDVAAAMDRGRAATEALLTERDQLRAELQQATHDYIRSQATAGINVERAGQPEPTYQPRSQPAMDPLSYTRGAAESAALRAIEQNVVGPKAQDRLDAVARDSRNDPLGIGARYLAAVADPHYDAAFGKLLAGGQWAHLAMTPQEQAAVRSVLGVQQLRASMAENPGEDGGFAVPIALDPTIIETGDGTASPLRQLARVITIATRTWRGVSSAGVSANYGAELTDADDGSPHLVQPEIETEKAQAWIPFSIELGMDWGGLRTDLARLLATAKRNLEGLKFAMGGGATFDEPMGLYVGAGLAFDSGGDTSIVGGAGFDVNGFYDTQAALPAGYSGNATWLANIGTLNAAARLVGSADATEPQIYADGKLLRKPYAEVSDLPDLAVVYGDIRAAFTIVDRIGLQVELVPLVMNPSTGKPNGSRGLYAYWRNSSLVVNGNAIRAIAPAS
jgi:HK97 family phage major capsid protein